jgi:pyridoxal phosphate enzyme (YggS family)
LNQGIRAIVNSKKDLIKQEQKLRGNIDNLRKEIYSACVEAGRDMNDITIIAATKYASAEQVGLISRLGIKDFGENRAEELKEKYHMAEKDSVWHFIGHLQSRKVKIVVPLVDFIHSIDKISTLSKVDDESKRNNKIQKLLVELNISGEETKYGMDPEDLYDFIDKALSYRNTKIVGLMTMAPLTDDLGLIRKIFSRLRILRDNLNKDFRDIELTELSMGMSNDFKIAIEEGATMIRIGSMIFK